MKQNSYLGLLDNDTIMVSHPLTGKAVKLYRVIALHAFKLHDYDFINSSKSFELTDKISQAKSDIERFEIRVEDVKGADGNTLMPKHELDNLLFQAETELKIKQNELDSLLNALRKVTIDFDVKFVKQFEVGGYVESLDNVDENTPVWIANRAKVFDSAKIKNGSYISHNAVVFGNSIVDCSRVKDTARVYGNSKLYKTTMSGLSEIKDAADVQYSSLHNSSIISGNASVTYSTLKVGACIRDNSTVISSELTDTSRVLGNSKVENCVMEGSSVVKNESIQFKNMNYQSNLKAEVFDGNLSDVKPVSVTFNGLTYSGWAPLVPGHSKSLLYTSKDMKTLAKTAKGLHIIVTAPEVTGKDVF